MHKHRLEAWHETLNFIQGFETALMPPQSERLEITPYLIHIIKEIKMALKFFQ